MSLEYHGKNHWDGRIGHFFHVYKDVAVIDPSWDFTYLVCSNCTFVEDRNSNVKMYLCLGHPKQEIERQKAEQQKQEQEIADRERNIPVQVDLALGSISVMQAMEIGLLLAECGNDYERMNQIVHEKLGPHAGLIFDYKHEGFWGQRGGARLRINGVKVLLLQFP